MVDIFRLLRVHQYIKNLFVLIGVIFSRQWDAETLFSAGLVFLAFCAISSAVYIVNDLFDVKLDRKHPVKKSRPIASGSVSQKTAILVIIVLVCIALTLASIVNFLIVMFVLMYAFLNIAYSWRLKHIAILDIFCISTGFMLRILAGTIGLEITPSSWLLLCGLMLTLFLGFTKRRAELLTLEQIQDSSRALTRRVLDDYTPAAIEQFIAISASATIIAYSLYTVSTETTTKYGEGVMIYTVPFVIYGIYRYILMLHMEQKGNDAAKDLYTDPHLLITVSAWLVATLVILT